MQVLAFVIAPLVVGYILGRKGWLPERWTNPIQKAVLIGPMPLVSWLGIWQLQWQWRLAWLPACGLLVAAANLGVGYMLWKTMARHRPGGASLMFTASLSNMGATGGNLIVLFLLGHQAVGEGLLWFGYYWLYAFGICFPIAAALAGPEYLGRRSWRHVIFAPHSLPVAGTVAGCLCLAFHLPVGEWVRPTLEASMVISSVVALGALGSRIRVSKVRHYLKEVAAICTVKFVLTPVIALALAALVGFSPLTRSMIVVMALCPVGMYSVVASQLFDLDYHQANSVFLITTVAFFVIIVPLLGLAQHLGWLEAYVR